MLPRVEDLDEASPRHRSPSPVVLFVILVIMGASQVDAAPLALVQAAWGDTLTVPEEVDEALYLLDDPSLGLLLSPGSQVSTKGSELVVAGSVEVVTAAPVTWGATTLAPGHYRLSMTETGASLTIFDGSALLGATALEEPGTYSVDGSTAGPLEPLAAPPRWASTVPLGWVTLPPVDLDVASYFELDEAGGTTPLVPALLDTVALEVGCGCVEATGGVTAVQPTGPTITITVDE